jgi:hypothetical protein
LLLALPLWACDRDGPLDRAGEEIDEAIDDVSDGIEDARDELTDD